MLIGMSDTFQNNYDRFANLFAKSKNIRDFDILNIYPHLLIKMVVSNLSMSKVQRQRHIVRILATPRKIFCFPKCGLGGK